MRHLPDFPNTVEFAKNFSENWRFLFNFSETTSMRLKIPRKLVNHQLPLLITLSLSNPLCPPKKTVNGSPITAKVPTDTQPILPKIPTWTLLDHPSPRPVPFPRLFPSLRLLLPLLPAAPQVPIHLPDHLKMDFNMPIWTTVHLCKTPKIGFCPEDPYPLPKLMRRSPHEKWPKPHQELLVIAHHVNNQIGFLLLCMHDFWVNASQYTPQYCMNQKFTENKIGLLQW